MNSRLQRLTSQPIALPRMTQIRISALLTIASHVQSEGQSAGEASTYVGRKGALENTPIQIVASKRMTSEGTQANTGQRKYT